MKVPCSAGLAAAGEARQTARMAPTPQIVPNLRIENPFPHRWPAVDLLYRHPLRGGLACQGAVASRLAVLIWVSVTSDAVEKVPTGGELTRFEAVGRARAWLP